MCRAPLPRGGPRVLLSSSEARRGEQARGLFLPARPGVPRPRSLQRLQPQLLRALSGGAGARAEEEARRRRGAARRRPGPGGFLGSGSSGEPWTRPTCRRHPARSREVVGKEGVVPSPGKAERGRTILVGSLERRRGAHAGRTAATRGTATGRAEAGVGVTGSGADPGARGVRGGRAGGGGAPPARRPLPPGAGCCRAQYIAGRTRAERAQRPAPSPHSAAAIWLVRGARGVAGGGRSSPEPPRSPPAASYGKWWRRGRPRQRA